jgi:flagellar hook-associated protein 1
MPGLFTTLASAANSMSVYDKVLSTVSDNIDNATTPGYAKQRISTLPSPFDPASGLAGGITAGPLENSRDEYSEASVRRNLFAYGDSEQMVSTLASVDPLFDVTGDSGVPGALNQLFQSFSSWSVSPNDPVARQTVLENAGLVAQRFNETAAGLNQVSSSLNDQLQTTTGTINTLAGQIASINHEIQTDYASASNPATDTSIHNALENLAEYGDFTMLKQGDGSYTVLLGGQTPIVMGSQAFGINADTSTGTAVIVDSNGQDITTQLTGGKLKALVDLKNTVLPGFSNGLNQLAAGLADSVNQTLAGGLDATDQFGAGLFAYNTNADAAFTMQVTGITPDQLAAALPGGSLGNANALALTALANSPQVNGMTFMQSYSTLASQVGTAVQNANDDKQTRSDLLVQARSMRSDLQSVSLDEEAAQIMQFQRAYEATARLVSTLNDLTETTMQMLR